MVGGLGAVLAALVLLLLGGDSLLRGVAGLGRRLGMTASLAGLLALWLATVAPELALATQASVSGRPEWALGLAIGAAILVAGIGLAVALARPAGESMPANLPALATFALIASGGLVFLGRDGHLDRGDALVLLSAYLLASVFAFGRARLEPEAVRSQWSAVAQTSTRADQNLVRLLIAGAVLYLAARWLLAGTTSMPGLSARPDWALGLCLAAPALALARIGLLAMLAWQEQASAAVQAIFATFLFNALAIPGALAAWRPLAMPPALFVWAMPALLAMALLLLAAPAGARGRGLVAVPALLALAWWATDAWRLLA